MKNRAQPQNAECLFTRYKAWADEIFLSVVSELPPQELTAPRPIGFGSLIRTLNHPTAWTWFGERICWAGRTA